jgi:uncharacterized protein (DUF302 family)
MLDQFTVEHLEYETRKSFDDAVAALEAATGDASESRYAEARSSSKDAAEFERRIKKLEGSSGFMRFLILDHGSWLSLFGVPMKAKLFILGNPLIARTMLEHNVEVGLNVPVRLMIYENGSGQVRLGYDLPSSLMSRLNQPEVTSAALKLDAKLALLAEQVTGEAA